MKATVVRLRKDGCRLTKEEKAAAIAAPDFGWVVLSRQPGEKERRLGKPFFTEARLYENTTWPARGSRTKPLFEPVLVSVDERGMVLEGFEICQVGETNGVTERVQVWLVKPIMD